MDMPWKTSEELTNALLSIPDIAQRDEFLRQQMEKYGMKVIDLLMSEERWKGKKWRTVEELLSIPEVAKTQAAVRQEIEDRIERNRIFAEPITRDLQAVGVELAFADLVNSGAHYPAAISVLLKHFFFLDYPENFREAMVGWFASVKARVPQVSRTLIDEFIRLPPRPKGPLELMSGYKFQVANALAEVTVEEHLPEIINLLNDRHHGHDRYGLIFAVARFRKSHPEAMAVLKEFAKDKESNLGKAARRALRGQGLFPNSKI
jgi:hypothetical protein